MNDDKRLFLPRDEFEEEASEGLGKLSRGEAQEDINELKARVDRRIRRPRNIWLPAAAAVVILLVASAAYISMFRERPGAINEIALAGKPVADTTPGGEKLAETALVGETISDTALIAMAGPIVKQQSVSSAGEVNRGLARARQDKYVPAVLADIDNKKAATRLAEAKKEATDEVYVLAEEEAAAHEAIAEAAAREVIKETVANEVVVEAIPRMEKAALQEKKANGAGTAMTPLRPASSPEYIAAAPVGGMAEFTEWMQKNIKYPEKTLPRTRQVVLVVFRVRADSTIYDLRVESTPGEPFTAEAFRLLREGPKWVPAVRSGQLVDDETRVSFVFK